MSNSGSSGRRTNGAGAPDPSQYDIPQDDEVLPSHIGVPPGYVATRPRTVDWGQERRRPGGGLEYSPGRQVDVTVEIPPTFEEGTEYAIYRRPPEQIAALQADLVRAGLLDEESYRPGFVGGGVDDPTLVAVRLVMSYANRAGYTRLEDAMRAYIAAGYGELDDRDTAARLPAPVSNADDLRQVFRAAVIDSLGQGWSQDQIDGLVDVYQAAERRFNAAVAAGEPIDEQIANPDTFARQQARAADPMGSASQDFLGVGNQLMSMLGGWSGRG